MIPLKGCDFAKSAEGTFRSGRGSFSIGVRFDSIFIRTPLRSILIERISTEGEEPEESPHPALLAIAEAVIHRFSAVLDQITIWALWKTTTHYYEPWKPNLSGQIREIRMEHLRLRKDTIKNIEKSARGTQRVIMPSGGRSVYTIESIGEWEDYVLETALFASENNYSLPLSAVLHRIRYIVDCFWGRCTHDNVIVSLFEKGELTILGEVHTFKSLEEIHRFLIDVVIEKMHKKAGMSKEEIVKLIDLPFVKYGRHPLIDCCGLLADEGVIAQYESGLSTQEIYMISDQSGDELA